MPRVITQSTITATERPKARKAKTQAEAPKPEAVHAADVDSQDHETLFARMRDAADRYWAALKMPTWRRRLFAIVAGLVTFSAVYYYGMAMLEVLALAMLSFSGPGFLTFLVVFLGMFALLVGAVTAGNWVASKAMTFEYSNVKASVGGFFGSLKKTLGIEPVPATAQ